MRERRVMRQLSAVAGRAAPLSKRRGSDASRPRARPTAPDADAELEARLAAFKGTKNWKDVRAEREGGAEAGAPATPATPAAPVDWGTETVFFEGPPSRGDLAVNVLLGFTLLWLARAPLGPQRRPRKPRPQLR